jgi:hypothetical protein
MSNSKVIHVQTTIQTILGVLDENGNVIQKQPLNVEVSVLSVEAFTEAVNVLLKAKLEFQSRVNESKDERTT